MSVTRLPRAHRADYIPAAIHPDVVIARLARALSSEGLAFSTLADGRLLIHEHPEYRAEGVLPSGYVPSFLRWERTHNAADDGSLPPRAA